MNIKSVLIFVVFWSFPGSYGRIPCPLLWKTISAEDTIPENIVGPNGATGNSKLPSRIWNYNLERYHGGSVVDSQAFYYNNGRSEVTGNYELLTNPHKCKIRWVDISDLNPDDQEFITNVGDAPFNNKLGRSILQSRIYYGDVLNNRIYLSLSEFEVEVSTRYQLLLSYSFGLNLDLKHFKLANDNLVGSKEYLGQDEIINNAETEIRQSIRISKTIREETTIESMRSWSKLAMAKVTLDFSVTVLGFNVPIGGVGFMAGTEEGEYKNSSFTRGSERLMVVEREIIVPPRTALKATSELTMVNDFSSDYEATGEYSAPGLTAKQVQDILKEDNLVGELDTSRNIVSVQINGKIKGSLALFNQFNIEELK